MKIPPFLLLGFLVLMGTFTSSAQPVSDPNPALIYWQGISQLPEFSKEQTQLMGDVLIGKTSPTPEISETFLQPAERALNRFKRASQSLQPCEWGTTLEDGPHAMLPYLPRMQQIARLALFKAETLFSEGKTEEAFAWILMVQKSARHIGTGGVLMSILIEQSTETQAVQIAARHALTTESSIRKLYLESFLKLPPLHTTQYGMESERMMADWLQRNMLGIDNSPEKEKALLDMADTFFQTLPKNAKNTNPTSLDEVKTSLEDWKKMAAETRTFYDRINVICAQPWSEALPEIKRLQLEARDSNSITRSLLPSLEGALRKEFELKTRYTMLQAALILGPDLKPGPLANYKDSFEDKPLLVEQDGNVFKIVMQNKINGREISMKIGR